MGLHDDSERCRWARAKDRCWNEMLYHLAQSHSRRPAFSPTRLLTANSMLVLLLSSDSWQCHQRQPHPAAMQWRSQSTHAGNTGLRVPAITPLRSKSRSSVPISARRGTVRPGSRSLDDPRASSRTRTVRPGSRRSHLHSSTTLGPFPIPCNCPVTFNRCSFS